jgi:hypothetical protein
MKKDVAAYMGYYNLDRLHTVNSDMSPAKYEKVFNQAAERDCWFCSSGAGSTNSFSGQQEKG